MAMTTIAQRMPAAERAVCAFDAIDEMAIGQATPTRSFSVTDFMKSKVERGERRSARSEYAWVEAAALAGAHTPRG